MLSIIKPQTTWDDMWKTMDALMQYPFKEKNLETNGLKTLIRRPHNIVNVKDENGNVIAQNLEVVTTPFSKNDVKVSFKDNTLSVECGNQNEVEEDKSDYVYKGISSQSYTFALKLGDNIDREKIKAKNVDGVLTVTLPFKQTEEEKITNIEVE